MRRPAVDKPQRSRHGLAARSCRCLSFGSGLLCQTCLSWHALWLRLQERRTARALEPGSRLPRSEGGRD